MIIFKGRGNKLNINIFLLPDHPATWFYVTQSVSNSYTLIPFKVGLSGII